MRRKIISVEEAVRKMTGMPAERMKLKRRGKIEEGFYADINVFQPGKFCDLASYEFPRKYPEGLEYCFVNGKKVLEKDKVSDGQAGKVLKLT